jgi:serine protease AprX
MSKSTKELIEDLIFNRSPDNIIRFTQDSPIYPDVWMEYFMSTQPIDTLRVDLILTPHKDATTTELYAQILKIIGVSNIGVLAIASSTDTVVAKLTLHELVTLLLPLTKWWKKYIVSENSEKTPSRKWLEELVGAILYYKASVKKKTVVRNENTKTYLTQFEKKFSLSMEATTNTNKYTLWSISRNRKAYLCIDKSVSTTKADSARKLFDISCSDMVWAVLDTGIDARHDAFRKKETRASTFYTNAMGAVEDPDSNHTRIIATYDFTKFRELLSEVVNSNTKTKTNTSEKIVQQITSSNTDKKLNKKEINDHIKAIEKDLKDGRMIDWSYIAPLLRIPHNEKEYTVPDNPHGTHVAGIIGANLIAKDLIGMCPEISLYDIRVFGATGEANEFTILAAIQFIRWLNNQRGGTAIHGVNLSFSMKHEVSSYACGQTPVCEACEKLVADGTVVVAAAGNLGQAYYGIDNGQQDQGFRTVNITDPGNANAAITVGATHRSRPHTYGISYFSSKGPTGDGRNKPDIIAPGEKIVSTVLNNAWHFYGCTTCFWSSCLTYVQA